MSLMKQALNQSVDGAEVGEMLKYANRRMIHVMDNIVQMNKDRGIKGKYYIHFWFQQRKEGYEPNFQCRRTRPSPYQKQDHMLWSVTDSGQPKYEWAIPKKEVITYILANPHDFDPEYVKLLKEYKDDKLEKIEDYLVDGDIA